MKRTLITAVAIIATLGTQANAETLVAINTDIGQVVAAGKTGMTLYTFRNDAANQSNCYNDCAQAWPPFTAGQSAKADGALGIIDRTDGTRQWVLNGQPLYFWAGDSARGDATGDGVGGVWDVVRNGS
ncbi:MAG: hypothetical protein AAFO80_01200 [Pseudomonadota bacterium]